MNLDAAKAHLAAELRTAKLRIDALPTVLSDVGERLYAAKTAITPLRNSVQDREHETMLIVESLRIDDQTLATHGKPVFNNDAARKAEVKRRLQTDVSYKETLQGLSRAEAVKDGLDREQTTLELEFRAKESYINATCAEVHLITSGS